MSVCRPIRFKFVPRSIVVIGGLLLAGCYSSAVPENSEQASVINIRIAKADVDPASLTIPPGGTVVWVNEAGAEVKVRFLNRTVSTSCEAARGFRIGAAGILESEPIKEGGVASICFLEPHTYRYQVQLLDQGAQGAHVMKGEIQVK